MTDDAPVEPVDPPDETTVPQKRMVVSPIQQADGSGPFKVPPPPWIERILRQEGIPEEDWL